MDGSITPTSDYEIVCLSCVRVCTNVMKVTSNTNSIVYKSNHIGYENANVVSCDNMSNVHVQLENTIHIVSIKIGTCV